jgi:hypothetical protein
LGVVNIEVLGAAEVGRVVVAQALMYSLRLLRVCNAFISESTDEAM